MIFYFYVISRCWKNSWNDGSLEVNVAISRKKNLDFWSEKWPETENERKTRQTVCVKYTPRALHDIPDFFLAT